MYVYEIEIEKKQIYEEDEIGISFKCDGLICVDARLLNHCILKIKDKKKEVRGMFEVIGKENTSGIWNSYFKLRKTDFLFSPINKERDS